MIQNNIVFKVSLICGLAVAIGYSIANSYRSNEIKVVPPLQIPAKLVQDSTFIFFSLEDDTVFIGKKFPPEGAKIDQGTFWPTDTNKSESNTIRETIKAIIDTARYPDLRAKNVWISLTFYVDSTQVIREAQIRLKREFEVFFNTDDFRNICMSVKGLKFTLPPEYRHLPYVRFSQGVSFK